MENKNNNLNENEIRNIIIYYVGSLIKSNKENKLLIKNKNNIIK